MPNDSNLRRPLSVNQSLVHGGDRTSSMTAPSYPASSSASRTDATDDIRGRATRVGRREPDVQLPVRRPAGISHDSQLHDPQHRNFRIQHPSSTSPDRALALLSWLAATITSVSATQPVPPFARHVPHPEYR